MIMLSDWMWRLIESWIGFVTLRIQDANRCSEMCADDMLILFHVFWSCWNHSMSWGIHFYQILFHFKYRPTNKNIYVIMYHGIFFLLSSISALCYESNYYFSFATIYSLTMQKRQPSHLLLEYYKFKFNYLNKLKTVIRFLLKRNWVIIEFLFMMLALCSPWIQYSNIAILSGGTTKVQIQRWLLATARAEEGQSSCEISRLGSSFYICTRRSLMLPHHLS